MPSRRGIVGRQPRANNLVMSRSLRGVPSGGIKDQLALESQHRAHRLRQLPDGQVLSAPDVDDFGGIVAFQQEEAGVRKVIDMEKFAPGRSGAPDREAFSPPAMAS